MALFNKMTDEEKRAKEREKRIERFQKGLGVFGASEDIKRKAILEWVKTVKNYWGETFLTEEQENDAGFILQIVKTNEEFINYWLISKSLKNDTKFVLEFLELAYKKNKIQGRSDYFGYYSELKHFPIRQNLEFLIEFARKFPDCNFAGILSRVVSEHYSYTEREKAFDGLMSKLPKDVCISQARQHGHKFVRHVSRENPNYLEIMMTGIESDGFKSLACLPKEKIWENRDLIALASKHDNFEGLKRYFLGTLSPHQERDYVSHEEFHSYSYTEFELYPLRKALIEDDMLFDSIESPKADKDKLRAYIAKETREFYEQVKPYEERGLVASKGNKDQTVGSAMTSFLFGENATAEDESKSRTVVEKIAQNIQNANKGSK